jgi:hypothetical protein
VPLALHGGLRQEQGVSGRVAARDAGRGNESVTMLTKGARRTRMCQRGTLSRSGRRGTGRLHAMARAGTAADAYSGSPAVIELLRARVTFSTLTGVSAA